MGETNIRQVKHLLKSVVTILSLNNDKAIENTVKELSRLSVTQKSEVRKKAIGIIVDEICQQYGISEQSLYNGTKHVYNNPRMICYYLLYMHAGLNQSDIAKIFYCSVYWINKNISMYRKLNPAIKTDRTVLDDYEIIFNRAIQRLNEIKP